MDADPPVSESPLKDKADALHALISGPFAAAAVKASSRSRSIPAGKDFHFYYNFDEFKAPVKEIKEKAESSLRSIAASDSLWGSKKPPQFPEDLDDAYDWLISINDELVDRLAVSMDEFKSLREKEEAAGGNAAAMELEGGFQLVYGKKKKKGGPDKDEGLFSSSSSTVVNMAMKDKRTTAARSKVPFHIPTIPRPQDEYSIIVNNKNQPFEHVWLETSADGSRFVHPLEKLSVTNFVDGNCEGEPVQPPPLETTPFKLVEVVNDLKMLVAKLRGVNEFAVDLEHNQYRSFQGLTCLMQISTRTEDFVIDTLKLRIHIGPHLREVFKDPSKRKIMHGADRDIIWLQRDFGIYVCNLFDTGQTSRVLQLERYSLEHLLSQFCGVNANKEYQTADWRLRPLPEEMLKYAREDTHYLLYIHDEMKRMLLAKSSNENDLLLEVYKRSSEICMQLYEKELLTDTSYLNIYGLSYADFNSKQLAVAAGLFQWRDTIARVEDESTGYILPNKTLLEIARQLPLTSGKLRRLVKSKPPFVERHLNSVIGIIKSSIANSYLFEGMAEQLKERLMEANVKEDICNSESPANDDLVGSTNIDHVSDISIATIASVETVKTVGQAATDSLEQPYTQVPNPRSKNSPAIRVEQENNLMSSSGIGFSAMQSYITEKDDKETIKNISTEFLQPRKSGGASVQQLEKPTCAFGALFGNTSSRRKPAADKVGLLEQDKNVNKVEQIQSTVALPFYHFSGVKPSEQQVKENVEPLAAEILQQHPTDLAKLEDVIPLDRESEDESPSNSAMEDDGTNSKECPDHPEFGVGGGGDCQPECNISDEPMSPSDLSSSFEKCFQSLNERMDSQQKQKPSQEPTINFNLKPFDYSAARKNLMLGKVGEDEAETQDNNKTFLDSKQKPKDSVHGKDQFDEQSRGSQQPRRRQAFPPSGNRSTTYH